MDWSFGDVLWMILVFFFWFVFIWMFISVFSDVLRRNDISGWSKALWVLLIVVLPFIGILFYMIFRPRMTPQDRQIIEEVEQRQRRAAGYSAADEIAKAAELRDKGAISEDEFQSIKRKALL